MPQYLSTLMETVRYMEVIRAKLPTGKTTSRKDSNVWSGTFSRSQALVTEEKIEQRMKMMSTTARQVINLWKVSLNSFLQRMRILVTFPAK